MAGTVTRGQAEAAWRKYNKDDNDELTVEEVQQAIKGAFGDEEMDDKDVQGQYVFFGQKEPKNLKKEEFIQGMMRTQKCKMLEKAFKEMDTDGNGCLSKDELEAGLGKQGFEPKVCEIIVEELEFDSDGKYSTKEFLETFSFSEMFAKSYDV